MESLNLTDWNLMCNEFSKRSDYYNTFQYATREEKEKLPPKPQLIAPKCYPTELAELDLAIATMSKPTKAEDSELFSPSLTLATIKDQRLKDYLKYVALESGRSNLYRGTAKENLRYSLLTPIFLAAHKEYNNIMYEQWDKSDKFIRFCVGNKLYDSIAKWRKIPLSDAAHKIARTNALSGRGGKVIEKTAYPFHNIKIDSTTKLTPSDPFRHMWLQTWIANIELRNEYMILDVNNWDLMPEAYDAVFVAPEPVKFTPEEEQLPW